MRMVIEEPCIHIAEGWDVEVDEWGEHELLDIIGPPVRCSGVSSRRVVKPGEAKTLIQSVFEVNLLGDEGRCSMMAELALDALWGLSSTLKSA